MTPEEWAERWPSLDNSPIYNSPRDAERLVLQERGIPHENQLGWRMTPWWTYQLSSNLTCLGTSSIAFRSYFARAVDVVIEDPDRFAAMMLLYETARGKPIGYSAAPWANEQATEAICAYLDALPGRSP